MKKKPLKKKLPFYAKVAGGNARSRPDRVSKRQEGGSLRSESTELAKARRGFEKSPKDVDAARKMIRTEDETGAYLPTKATGEGRY